MTRVIAGEIRRYRQARGLSAQKLADRCAELGHGIPRSVIANLENGARETVTVAELQVLARALDVPPVLLLFPIGWARAVEVVPGQEMDPWQAFHWFAGADSQEDPNSPIRLWREHETNADLLATYRRQLAERAAKSAASGQPDDLRARLDAATLLLNEKSMEMAAMALRRIRANIRAAGLTPPGLDAELAAAIGEDADDGPR